MPDEKKKSSLPYIGVGAICLALGLFIGLGIATSKECPECPEAVRTGKIESVPAPSASEVEVDLEDEKPEEVPSEPKDPPDEPLVPAPKTSDDGWLPIVDEQTLANLAGEWGDPQHRPTPIVRLQYKREGSKTPFNVRWHITATDSGGCGFCLKGMEDCDQGIAHCKIHDEDNKKIPKEVKSTASFEMQGELLRVTINDITQLVVAKKPEKSE